MTKFLSILIIRKPYLLPVLAVVYQIFLKAGVLCCEWWDIGGFLLSEPTELPANNNDNRSFGNIQYPEAIEKLGGLLLDFPPENSSPSSPPLSDNESSGFINNNDAENAHEICFNNYYNTVNIDSGNITNIFRDTMTFVTEIISAMKEVNDESFQVDYYKLLIDPLASYIDETHPHFQHFVYYKAGFGMYDAMLTAKGMGEVPESLLIYMFNKTVEANL